MGNESGHKAGLPCYVALGFCCVVCLLVMLMFWQHTSSFGHPKMLEKSERIDLQVQLLTKRVSELEVDFIRHTEIWDHPAGVVKMVKELNKRLDEMELKRK